MHIKSNFKKEIKNILITLISALLSALTLHMIVSNAGFAPSGIDGIAIMIQYIFGINVGWTTLIFNIPLLLIALFFLKKRYVIYTISFTLLSSCFLMVTRSFSSGKSI